MILGRVFWSTVYDDVSIEQKMIGNMNHKDLINSRCDLCGNLLRDVPNVHRERKYKEFVTIEKEIRYDPEYDVYKVKEDGETHYWHDRCNSEDIENDTYEETGEKISYCLTMKGWLFRYLPSIVYHTPHLLWRF